MNKTKWKILIESKGLKITWIAKHLNIHRTQLSQYINNLSPMPEHIEKKLNDLLR